MSGFSKINSIVFQGLAEYLTKFQLRFIFRLMISGVMFRFADIESTDNSGNGCRNSNVTKLCLDRLIQPSGVIRSLYFSINMLNFSDLSFRYDIFSINVFIEKSILTLYSGF